MDELKWGLRALDDIPKGSFVCTYIGHIYTEKGSDEVKGHGCGLGYQVIIVFVCVCVCVCVCVSE